MNTFAIIRQPDPSIVNCELTHMSRVPIDFEELKKQHANYGETLRKLGLQVDVLPVLEDFPDSVFVEDTAVVLDEAAILTRPGALSRRSEPEAMHPFLVKYRRNIFQLIEPAILDGGDVLTVDKTIFVGLTSRTNELGAKQLQFFTTPYGYRVVTIPVTKCLHLRTALAYLGKKTMLLNPEWIDETYLKDFKLLRISQDEPFGANALKIGSKLVYNSDHPKTLQRLRDQGFDVEAIRITELAKAEAGLTCLSLVFRQSEVSAGR